MAVAEMITRGSDESKLYAAMWPRDPQEVNTQAPMPVERLRWSTNVSGKKICRAWISVEKRGFSIVSTNLPGVCSQGDTVQQAKNNIAAAFRAAIAVYSEEGLEVPWSEASEAERPASSTEVWIAVDA
jgi:predicted RNase H-like HicB family nuclease